MEKGQRVKVKIEDMTVEGQGVGRSTDGLTVFIKGAVLGDTVTAELTKVKKRYAFGRLLSVDTPSKERIEPFCEYFGVCGGCPYGQLSYDGQLSLKEKQVYDKLCHIGGLKDPVVRPIVAMEEPFRYRNKATMPVWTGGIITRKGGVVENLGDPSIGFYRAKSHEVVDCYDCFLQSEPAMAAAEALRVFMREDNVTAFDPAWNKGLIRHLIVKTAKGTGEVMVILVVNGKGIPNGAKLVEFLDEAIYNLPPAEDGTEYTLESVIVNINKASGEVPKATLKNQKNQRGKGSAKKGQKNGQKNGLKESSSIRPIKDILGDEFVTLAGKPTILERVGDLCFEISPRSFYQVNPVQMKKLYDKAMEYAKLTGDETILDLYCGVGTIGLYAAKKMESTAGQVIGIESVKEAVLDANRNAVINNIVNARYVCGKAEEELPKLISGEGLKDPSLKINHADVVFLDPPRAGCDEKLLAAVAAISPSRIVYISCDPATLARDVKYLSEQGYRFEEATPVDMFPWTGHVETVISLSRKTPDDHIEIDLDLDELDATSAETKATYEEIKEYVLKETGLKVSTLYISQIKRKCGLEARDNYNLSKKENARGPQCPPDKERAIRAALKHFAMI